MLYSVNYSKLFIYKESNFLYFQTYLGSLKIYLKLSCLPIFSSIGIRVKASFFNNSTFFEQVRAKLIENIKQLTFSLLYGFSSKYKIKGLGYKSFFKDQIFLFKLGYSHKVFFFLPLNLTSKKKQKKVTFYTIKGIALNSLNLSCSIINTFRSPDIYSMNGIFNRITLISFKKGKKSFLM